jgi:hypothetical protein
LEKSVYPDSNPKTEKSAAVFAVRRANYTHRRKGVFNGRSIEDLTCTGNVRTRTQEQVNFSKKTPKVVKQMLFPNKSR